MTGYGDQLLDIQTAALNSGECRFDDPICYANLTGVVHKLSIRNMRRGQMELCCESDLGRLISMEIGPARTDRETLENRTESSVPEGSAHGA